jgi:hypothetical protein
MYEDLAGNKYETPEQDVDYYADCYEDNSE